MRDEHLYINLNQILLYVLHGNQACGSFSLGERTVDVSSCIYRYIGLLLSIYNMYCHDNYEIIRMIILIAFLYYCCNQ